MAEHKGIVDRESVIARVLRPLGTKPLTQEQAKQAAKLLNVHWTTVYRLRRRFLADPVASAVRPRARGPKVGKRRLGNLDQPDTVALRIGPRLLRNTC